MKGTAKAENYLEIEFARGYCENPLDHQDMFYMISNKKVNWKDVKCELCLRYFTEKGNLRRHKNLHSENDFHCCDICDFKTVIDEELEKHKYIHLKERCFQCIFCLKEFVNPNALSEHNCEKLRDKCSVCTLATVKFSHNIVHIKKCEGKSIIPYKCKFCLHKEYRIRCTFVEHMAKHIDFDDYSIKYSLKRSTLYKSSICQFTNRQSGKILEHEKRHETSKRRLSCIKLLE